MSSIAPYMSANRSKVLTGESRTPKPTAKKQFKAGQTERELVALAIRRDHAAFAQLYDRFVDQIFRYIYYKIGSRTDAEDLTAQVFMKAWEAIGNYRWTDRPFAAWLYRIAHNLIVDRFRAHHESDPLDEITSVPESGASVEEVVEGKLTGEALRVAIRRLTPDQQQVIMLRMLEGYDTAEVAAIMGKQEGAVRTLQHRALAALRLILAETQHEL